jgi:hypothetical protein
MISMIASTRCAVSHDQQDRRPALTPVGKTPHYRSTPRIAGVSIGLMAVGDHFSLPTP